MEKLQIYNRDLPSDLAEAKESILDKLHSIKTSSPLYLVAQKYIDKLEEFNPDEDDVSKLKAMDRECKGEVAEVKAGGKVLNYNKTKGKLTILNPDEIKEKVMASTDRISELKSKIENAESKSELDKLNKELEQKESKLKEQRDKVSNVVSDIKSGFSGLSSGNIGDFIEGVASIAGLLSKGSYKVLSALKLASDDTKGYRDKIDELENKISKTNSDEDRKKAQQEIDSLVDELNKIGESTREDINKVPDEEIQSDTQITEDEKFEVDSSNMKDLFEGKDGVHKSIETWDDAFDYGYAKLKQIHGMNYDDSIAKQTLEGLKSKYPDTPQAVLGALKYGKRSKTSDTRVLGDRNKRLNSRIINSILVSSDIDIVDKYSHQASSDSYRKVIRDIASDLGEWFDIRKSYDNPSDFMTAMASDNRISDRLYTAIEYLMSSLFRYKVGTSRVVNSKTSTLYSKVKKLVEETNSSWKVVFDSDDGVIELQSTGTWLTIDSANEKLVLSGGDVEYITSSEDKLLEEIEKFISK